jgi:hypothetical protein
MKNLKKFLLTPLLLVSFTALASADDVVDTLNEAIKSYESGEYSMAVEDLNYALQLIQQKKSKGLEVFLPEALPGWSAKKAKSVAAASAMFGGGISSSREYTKNRSKIKVEIITDSPLMQSMMGLFSNPMFATADGGKLERINREKAIVKYNEERESGEITIIVAKRFLVKVEGRRVPVDDLKAYAKAIDFAKLKKLP